MYDIPVNTVIRENFALNIYIRVQEKSKINFLIFYLKNLVSCLLLLVGSVDVFSVSVAGCAYTVTITTREPFVFPLDCMVCGQASSLTFLI